MWCGGVDGAIHRAAGPLLLAECREKGPCDTGDAKITKGYNLHAPYIIHTVGPVWYGGFKDEETLLKSCYRRSLEVADKHSLKTIAFPAISCGAYHFPIELACRIAIETVSTYQATTIEEVIFACFENKVERALHKELSRNS